MGSKTNSKLISLALSEIPSCWKNRSGRHGRSLFTPETMANFRSNFLVLKRIQPELRDSDQYVEMFKNEAEVAGLLQHPIVISIYEGVKRSKNGSWPWNTSMDVICCNLVVRARQRKKAVPFEVTTISWPKPVRRWIMRTISRFNRRET